MSVQDREAINRGLDKIVEALTDGDDAKGAAAIVDLLRVVLVDINRIADAADVLRDQR